MSSAALGELCEGGSDDTTCMIPDVMAIYSSLVSGRCFRLSFCLRFWNQI